MRILVVSQMYPGRADPDYGVFVRDLADALAARGHEVERAVLDRRAPGPAKYGALTLDALGRARRFRPDVVHAHFLVPTGLIGALAAGRRPLVVTAHGQDVRNAGAIRGVEAATRLVARRAAGLIAVSDHLRRELEERIPEARGKTEVVGSGVDVERFAPAPRADGEHPAYLCVGSLSERKNVLRLARAFERLGEGTLTFVGDGPLRRELEGRPGIRLLGPLPHEALPAALAAADVVCQPSLVEPLGQALLEAMAVGRPVVATRVGGPPEFVPPGGGVLVDPLDEEAIAAALAEAAALPVPNEEARRAAERHDVRVLARRVEEILARAARGRRS